MQKKLLQIAKELGIGLATAAEYLETKGYIVPANPNHNITEMEQELLIREFRPNLLDKFKSHNGVSYIDFEICGIHILPECEATIVKGLKEEWYLFNDRVKVSDGKLVKVDTPDAFTDYYGKNISICAIVGVNGSGKSSLLELLYRIINNISAILERGKRIITAETMLFIENLYAELYYIVENQLVCLSCKGGKIVISKGEESICFHAFETEKEHATRVYKKDYIAYADKLLFYTIVTNYSLQGFVSQDYKCEKCVPLDEKRDVDTSYSWLDGLMPKNDGYITPIVLNPLRKDGIIDMKREMSLSICRLASCFLFSRNNKHEFISNYQLNQIKYIYNSKFVLDKLESFFVDTKDELRNYVNKKHPTYVDWILRKYGFKELELLWNNDVLRMAAYYLVYKTLVIGMTHPEYEKYRKLSSIKKLLIRANTPDKNTIDALISDIKGDQSHITLKIRQTWSFLDRCCKNENIDISFFNFTFDEYANFMGVNKDSKKMEEIQNSLPPSFFSPSIELDRFENNEKQNNKPIRLERLSAGERQYLYTFCTYIYHCINLLSIKSTHRVKYRRFNLVMDEVEICFHPEYQRRFIDELIGYIKRLKINETAAINVIVATHSPFILSDIPQSRILYLENGSSVNMKENVNPFCANICDILYQSFFLKNGFIGEYSRKKLETYIKALKSAEPMDSQLKKEISDIIPLIGDDFIKKNFVELQRRKENEKNLD